MAIHTGLAWTGIVRQKDKKKAALCFNSLTRAVCIICINSKYTKNKEKKRPELDIVEIDRGSYIHGPFQGE